MKAYPCEVARIVAGAARACAFAVMLGLPGIGAAKIDLVTLPEKASTQLTIYNGEDLTLVRESRTLTFREGANQIQFSWANTKIDPTSVEILFKAERENFSIRDVTFPAGAIDTAVWNVESKRALSAEIEILYFTSGVSWEADYVGVANLDETELRVENFIRVTNRSGEDFEGAQVRVVVGTINLREKIAVLAEKYRSRTFAYSAVNGTVSAGDVWRIKDDNKPAEEEQRRGEVAGGAKLSPYALPSLTPALKQVMKEGLAEFQLYTIEGTEDLKDGWSKRLRAFAKDKVKIEVAYEQDALKYGPSITRLYRSRNDAENQLGAAPLPDGTWRIFRATPEGSVRWVGQFANKYVPVGEKIELNLLNDGQLTLEDNRLALRRGAFDFRRDDGALAGYDETVKWSIVARNASLRPVTLKLVRYFDGDWEVQPEGAAKSMKPEKRDHRSFVFETKIPGQDGVSIGYEVTTHKGTNRRQEAK